MFCELLFCNFHLSEMTFFLFHFPLDLDFFELRQGVKKDFCSLFLFSFSFCVCVGLAVRFGMANNNDHNYNDDNQVVVLV